MTPPWDSDDAFNWVDDYFAHIRPHYDVREQDALLIVLPNKAVRLNRTGLRTLQFLKQGGTIVEMLGQLGDRVDRRGQLFHFLCDFRSLMSGCLGEGRHRMAVETRPHHEPFNQLPVLSEIAVTYRCNLKCRFCYAACGCSKKPSSHELSTRDIIRVLGIIRNEAKVPSVSFTGGEPLLRSDIVTLVSAAVGTGLRTNLITNGTLAADNRLATHLKDAGLNSAQVSLEGPDAPSHDALTGVTGSFDRTVAGIAALRAADIHTHTNTTVNAANADRLVDLVRFVARLGLKRMSMNMIIPAGSALKADLRIPYSRIWAVIEPARAEARRLDVDFMWYSPTPLCILNPLAEGLGNKSCAACDGLLSIAPNGDVLPCSSYPSPVGNLMDTTFAHVWNSASAQFFRRKQHAPAGCSDCGEFAACAGACPLYWSAMGTTELAAAAIKEKDHAPA